MKKSVIGNDLIARLQDLGIQNPQKTEQPKLSWTYCSDGSCSGDCVGGCDGTPAGGFDKPIGF